MKSPASHAVPSGLVSVRAVTLPLRHHGSRNPGATGRTSGTSALRRGCTGTSSRCRRAWTGARRTDPWDASSRAACTHRDGAGLPLSRGRLHGPQDASALLALAPGPGLGQDARLEVATGVPRREVRVIAHRHPVPRPDATPEPCPAARLAIVIGRCGPDLADETGEAADLDVFRLGLDGL